MFPTLRRVALTTKTSQVGCLRLPEMTRTQSKVEYISERPYFECTFQMIALDLCSRLKYLMLDFHHRYDYERFTLTLLKYMPVLAQLIVIQLKLRVMDLETLHNSIPSIQRLEFDELRICHSQIPKVIVPTTSSFTSFSLNIRYCDNFTILSSFYQYLSQKYVNVANWKYSGDVLCRIGRNATNHVYKNGIPQFLRLTTPALDELDLCFLQNEVNVFELSDERGSQIKKFSFCYYQEGTLIDNLVQSKQAKYVQDLSLFETEVDSLTRLECMMKLTTLSLFFNAEPNYLNTCPSTIKDFSITLHCI